MIGAGQGGSQPADRQEGHSTEGLRPSPAAHLNLHYTHLSKAAQWSKHQQQAYPSASDCQNSSDCASAASWAAEAGPASSARSFLLIPCRSWGWIQG